MKDLTLCFFLKHFPAAGHPLIGGTAQAVHGLAAALAGRGVDVTVMCEGPEPGRTITPAGYTILCGRSPRRWLPLDVDPCLRTFIAEELAGSGGLVVLGGMFHPRLYALARVLLRHRVPYVVQPFDPYHPAVFSRAPLAKWAYWHAIEKRLLRRAAAIQVMDAPHAVWLRRLTIHTPVFAVAAGFVPGDVPPENALVWRSAGPPRLLYLGRIDATNKGLDILLDAFAAILQRTAPPHDTHAGAHLTIQGIDGGDRAALIARAAALGLEDQVTFREPDFDSPAVALIAQHDVFCLPSRFEGFSFAVLEAMLAARVVLVSEIAGIASHVRTSGCGVVVEPDVMSVQSGLLALLDCREDWQAQGMAGRRYALANLGWEQVAARAHEHYTRLLE